MCWVHKFHAAPQSLCNIVMYIVMYMVMYIVIYMVMYMVMYMLMYMVMLSQDISLLNMSCSHVPS